MEDTLNDLHWHKSSYSGNGGGNCVEVAVCDGTVLVRDSKDHGCGPVQRYPAAEWRAFLARIRSGEFGPG